MYIIMIIVCVLGVVNILTAESVHICSVCGELPHG